MQDQHQKDDNMPTYKIPENIYSQYVHDVRAGICPIGFNKWLRDNFPGMELKQENGTLNNS